MRRLKVLKDVWSATRHRHDVVYRELTEPDTLLANAAQPACSRVDVPQVNGVPRDTEFPGPSLVSDLHSPQAQGRWATLVRVVNEVTDRAWPEFRLVRCFVLALDHPFSASRLIEHWRHEVPIKLPA